MGISLHRGLKARREAILKPVSSLFFDTGRRRGSSSLLLLNSVLIMSSALGSNGVRDEESTRITREQSNRGGADRGADSGADGKANWEYY
jgi:hypothetical protein